MNKTTIRNKNRIKYLINKEFEETSKDVDMNDLEILDEKWSWNIRLLNLDIHKKYYLVDYNAPTRLYESRCEKILFDPDRTQVIAQFNVVGLLDSDAKVLLHDLSGYQEGWILYDRIQDAFEEHPIETVKRFDDEFWNQDSPLEKAKSDLPF